MTILSAKEKFNQQLNSTEINLDYIENVNNPRSIHGLYPYRGKISAIEAKSIIAQLPKGLTMLDPFCGSGTIVYEAQRHGMNAIGLDLNPLAIALTKAKIYQPGRNEELFAECEHIIKSAKKILDTKKCKAMPEEPRKLFHPDTANEIMSVSLFLEKMTDYIKGAYYGAIALTARGCNSYKWTSSTVGKNIEPKRYINFYEKFIEKAKKHTYFNKDCQKANIICGDSRQLTDYIKAKTVDVVFTSPPYFDSLDYTAYYGKLIYEIHDVNRLEIKTSLIQNAARYEEDMKLVFKELEKVTTDKALIIFVVGDKKVKNKLIKGGEFFADICHRKPTYMIERSYTGTSSQIFDALNKTERKEQIIVWDKAKGLAKC